MPELIDLVRDELSAPVDPRAAAMARAIAAQYPGSARAVLFYGSCLRESELDGLMLDFYRRSFLPDVLELKKRRSKVITKLER